LIREAALRVGVGALPSDFLSLAAFMLNHARVMYVWCTIFQCQRQTAKQHNEKGRVTVSYSSGRYYRAWASVLAIAGMWIALSSPSAQADTIFTNVFTGTNFDIQISNPVLVGGTPLEAVTLRALGKNGTVPNTFDSNKSGRGGTGITTATNALYQDWEFNAVKTPTLTLNVPGSINQALDSHFLVRTDDDYLIVVKAPDEDRVANHTYDSNGGFGTFLTGTFSDTTTSSSSWDFAYLVVPNNTTLHLDFEIGGSGVSSETVNSSFTVALPEPSTLVLLGSSILGLLVYLRRRAA